MVAAGLEMLAMAQAGMEEAEVESAHKSQVFREQDYNLVLHPVASAPMVAILVLVVILETIMLLVVAEVQEASVALDKIMFAVETEALDAILAIFLALATETMDGSPVVAAAEILVALALQVLEGKVAEPMVVQTMLVMQWPTPVGVVVVQEQTEHHPMEAQVS